MPQITVIPALQTKMEKSAVGWDFPPDEDPVKKEKNSNVFCRNMKQRGSRIIDMKPLRCYTDAPLYEAFKPFIMAMKLFGLFHNKEYIIHKPKDIRGENDYRDLRPPLGKRITPSGVYCFLVMLLLWGNTIRFLSVFRDETGGFNPWLFQKAIMALYFFSTAVNATCCFIACHKYTNIPEFFYEWARLHQEYPDIPYCGLMARMIAVTMTVLSALTIGLSAGFCYYCMFHTQIFGVMLAPFTGQESYAVWIKAASFVVLNFTFGACFLPLCLCLVLCSVMRREFRYFRDDFKRFVAESPDLEPSSFQEKFEMMRRRHQHISTLVGHVDDFMSLYNGTVFVVSVINISLMLYLLIWESRVYEGDAVVLGMMVYWIGEAVLQLVVVLIGSAKVNDMAHSPFDVIHNLKYNAKANTHEFHIQLSLFLARLTGQPIGLTAMNLFVIDKPAILTVIGMFITYFVILVQFRPGLTSSDAPSIQETICNCTGS